MLCKFDGASTRRVIDRSRACVPEHAHDWPVLSIFVMGGYLNRTEVGQTFIAGPSAILYRAGAAHQNTASRFGFEQIEIEFDPRWLGRAPLPDRPVTRWAGGQVASDMRTLMQACREADAPRFRETLRGFLQRASCAPEHAPAPWLELVTRRLGEDANASVVDLARQVERHPSWLGTAYKRATGEGLLETMARRRVEHAACLLRETDRPGVDIAAEAGFCDQSHMNRTFRRLLGRPPSAVRDDRQSFRQATAP
ncbi:MAG: helix-turn-helix transcriptional regulator [Alphaproteobacteria bacterium]|nr:helix-turn-helix transcriptional regulator [Alphaproteobacteria bacterium]